MIEKQCVGFMNTHPLWVKEQFGVKQFDFPVVNLAGFRPEAIPNNIRLGHQMEYVFKQLIAHGEAYEIVLYNLPIKKGKLTIGEIDFILQHRATKKRIHIELTYKFYIIDPYISEPMHRLIGPNRRDMFHTKIEKIKNGQFQIVHTQEGVEALAVHNIEHTGLLHQACFKAQLFVPFTDTKTNIRPFNPQCIVGHWMRFDDFNSSEFKLRQFYLPSKSEWVIEPYLEVQWKNHFETLMELNLNMMKENAPMVWIKNSDAEFGKFFVVWW